MNAKKGRKPVEPSKKLVPVGISEYISREDKDRLFENGREFLALKNELKKQLKKGINKILSK